MTPWSSGTLEVSYENTFSRFTERVAAIEDEVLLQEQD